MSAGERPIGEDDIEALVDGRLDAERERATRAFVEARPDLALRVRRDREARAALRERLAAKAAEPVPTRLRVAPMLVGRRRDARLRLALAAAACLLLAVGSLLGWFARDALGGATPLRDRGWAVMAGDALAAHRTFAIEIVHPVEVKASEEDHLKRWLSKRLGRKLSVPDLEGFGLQLVGGRLLPAGRDVAALLMYADPSGSRLTVYVRSGQDGESALKFMREGELSSFAWMDGGYGYVVAAAMDRERLQSVARAVAQDVEMEVVRRAPHL